MLQYIIFPAFLVNTFYKLSRGNQSHMFSHMTKEAITIQLYSDKYRKQVPSDRLPMCRLIHKSRRVHANCWMPPTFNLIFIRAPPSLPPAQTQVHPARHTHRISRTAISLDGSWSPSPSLTSLPMSSFKWRSHLQGYTEEKVQKFRQLVRLFCDEPKGQQNWDRKI